MILPSPLKTLLKNNLLWTKSCLNRNLISPFVRGEKVSKANIISPTTSTLSQKTTRAEPAYPTEEASPTAEVAEEESTPSHPVVQPNPQISLSNCNPQPAGGNLSRYLSNWKNITHDSFVLNVVSEGYKIQILNSDIHLSPIISTPSKEKKVAILAEINSLLDRGFVSKIPHCSDHIISRVFIVPKKNGKNRMIIDLSRLNNFIKKVSFKMEDKTVIQSLIKENDFLVSIDLTDAFLSISLHESSKKFVVFEIDGQRYCYNRLVFGLTSSPRIFSKILKPAINFLRNNGIKISFYLDDIFICASSKSLALDHMNQTISLLTSLGFSINFEKSNLVPSHSMEHLGFLWNSTSMSISFPVDKLSHLKSLARCCLHGLSSLRTLAKLMGVLVSCGNSFAFAPLHYRSFQFCLLDGLRSCSSWDQTWPLSQDAIDDLLWWVHCSPLDICPVSFRNLNYDLTLYCDSSSFMWGATLSSGEIISGQWSKSESKEHINCLELRTVLLSVVHFLDLIKNKSILIRSDNSTAVSYINKMGGTHSFSLCSIALELWGFLQKNNISCHALHIKGSENSAAHFLSRFSHLHEYGLSPSAFQVLYNLLPFKLSMDLFASKFNAKLPHYVSLLEDNLATFINAFSCEWKNGSYLFPPIPMIPKVVSKILRDNIEFCVLITPAWDGMPVLPLIELNLICSPIFINASHLVGRLPFRHQSHLMAWCISSSSVSRRTFQRMSSKLLKHFIGHRTCNKKYLNYMKLHFLLVLWTL